MKSRLQADEIAAAFRGAVGKGLVSDDDTLLLFYDLDYLEERIDHLINAFPAGTLHAIAMKANPLEKILRILREKNVGTEVASSGEFALALNAGYPPQKIVFDSPVKTFSELEHAIRKGVHINIDSLEELDRIRQIRKDIPSQSTYGIRVNPQAGTGTIATSSVAGDYSKFGVPIRYRKEELLKAFEENDWLTGVHLHVGSQGCPPELLIKSIGILYDLAEEINRRRGHQQVSIFDIGGGLPISYHHEKDPPLMAEYAEQIRQRFPELFTPSFRLITEFGRWVHVNAGWAISRIEYVKNDGGIRTAMIHAGADLLLRECLLPSDWQHEYTVLDKNGKIKKSDVITPCHIAGPLCFSGDMPARNVLLPPVEPGDHLVIHDTGGYTFSMWSRYNSRFLPKNIGYRKNELFILKERETEEELINFWK